MSDQSGGGLTNPQVQFDGAVDNALDAESGEALVAALREALTNVARHARATHTWVDVVATNRDVLLRVVDDGVGPSRSTSTAGRGLPNLAERARRFGGTFSLTAAARGGSVAEWRIPASR